MGGGGGGTLGVLGWEGVFEKSNENRANGLFHQTDFDNLSVDVMDINYLLQINLKLILLMWKFRCFNKVA